MKKQMTAKEQRDQRIRLMTEMRERRVELNLRRTEVWAHVDDRQKVKEFAQKLLIKRGLEQEI